MTTPDLKELAKKAAEFLDCTYDEEIEQYVLPAVLLFYSKYIDKENAPYVFFHEERTAPILMHLAKREMEKRGWNWTMDRGFTHLFARGDRPECFVKVHCFNEKTNKHDEFDAMHENEFISFWTALLSAVGDSK